MTGRRSRAGNQLLSTLFGAHAHFTGAEGNHWGELEIAREALTDELQAAGAAPYTIPIGGSTAVGAVGYAVGFVEILEQCEEQGIAPAAIVHATLERRHTRRSGRRTAR